MFTRDNFYRLRMRSISSIAIAVFLMFGASQAMLGQTSTGNIVGRVTDVSGAVLPGVAVMALNPENGLTFRTVADNEGIYRFFYLTPATYTLTLPIMQRYTWMTMYLMPDVTSMNGFHIDGQRDRGLGYNLDGIPGTQPVIEGEATNRVVSTTPNAIEEVKLASTVLPAEFGHSAGGMLSATYKSGTNRFHFEGEDRYVNNDELHRAYFNLGNAPFSYHELSSLVSGPVYIPKVYKGTNKTFFLFGWSMHREKYNQSVFSSVPTPDELNGNFQFNGVGYPVYDPATITQANGKYTSTVEQVLDFYSRWDRDLLLGQNALRIWKFPS